MDLRSEFELAWKGGGDFDSLLELVHRHERQGLAPREAYWILHKLWAKCGYDDCEQSDELLLVW